MNQYYDTVGYQQPEYTVGGSGGSNLSAMQQNLKSESMTSFGTGQHSPDEPALLEAAGAGAAGAGDTIRVHCISCTVMQSMHQNSCCASSVGLEQLALVTADSSSHVMHGMQVQQVLEQLLQVANIASMCSRTQEIHFVYVMRSCYRPSCLGCVHCL